MIRFARDACALPVPFVRYPCGLRVFPVKDNPSVCLRQPPPFTQWRRGSRASFIRCVTVGFAPTIASLREGGGFCEAKDGRRERNKRLSIVIFRALSFVCGRGGEASAECLYRTLLQSPTVPASSRRKPWFERTLCVVCTRGVCGYCLF